MYIKRKKQDTSLNKRKRLVLYTIYKRQLTSVAEIYTVVPLFAIFHAQVNSSSFKG
ncbi:hypothetical protein SAMN05216180_0227 [Hydrogenoanaerobacterium saccharovorans]|uniref:Uncharacterized protein n=1 Tax=Hydrogenoanaerobacterium saccharovorans TaxID=474960 RepID=A0A1H7YT35_9FIRM|nr:hypothetical protein SAMN05216180_0227 [Hydrogenoanaerobacterium saccharovorans]